MAGLRDREAGDESDEGVDAGAGSRRGRRRALLKLLGLVALVGGGIALARLTPVGDVLSREGIDRAIALVRGSPWAPVLFVLAYGAAMSLALPGSALTLAGGALFGLGWGVVYNTLGANLGANAAFLLGRGLGRDGVERLGGDRLEKLDRATKEYGFKSLLTLRLIPLVPFNALNFGAGLTAISWGTYAGATALGIFPGTVVYTMFADALLEGSREASRDAFIRMIVSGALLVLLSFLPTIAKKMNVKITNRVGLLLVGLAVCAPGTPAAAQGTPPAAPAAAAPDPAVPDHALPDHALFTEVLSRHLRDHRVDYASLKEERESLDRYLDTLAQVDPGELAASSRDARLAFWINAYNACMLRLVVDHYPLTDQTPSLFGRLRNALADRPEDSVWRIPDVFTRKHCRVADAERSQDEIEHEILRPMGEPRIHFAVNCAAASCPVLAGEAYGAGDLDAQLDRQVAIFMGRPGQYRLEEGDPPLLRVNKVLDWYGEDFGGAEGVKRFFAGYEEEGRARLLRDPATRVEYFEYDWTLNDAGR
ncbi:MAG TPA: VTT domain-containing protein [Longimicrobiales bacterium]|nr:VTT domain-containing protein [Longimicrobiales bacterium]